MSSASGYVSSASMPASVIDHPPIFEAQPIVAASPILYPSAVSKRGAPLGVALSSREFSTTLRLTSSSTRPAGTLVPASRRTSRAVLTSSPHLNCSSAMARPLSRRRIKDRLVRLASPRCHGHRVVDFQDQLLGAEVAVAL